MLNKNSGVQK